VGLCAHKQSAFKPAQLTQGKTHRLNPLPRLLFPIASQGSAGARVDLQAGASPSAQVEEQQPAHITCKFVSVGSNNEQKASYFHYAHVLLIRAPWKVILRMTVWLIPLPRRWRSSNQRTSPANSVPLGAATSRRQVIFILRMFF
jgi:hypothetical protein